MRPDHDWQEWRFVTSTKHLWDNVENHRRFIEWVGKKLGVEELKDWYGVSAEQVDKLGGSYRKCFFCFFFSSHSDTLAYCGQAVIY
jgi:hypothetical protein